MALLVQLHARSVTHTFTPVRVSPGVRWLGGGCVTECQQLLLNSFPVETEAPLDPRAKLHTRAFSAPSLRTREPQSSLPGLPASAAPRRGLRCLLCTLSAFVRFSCPLSGISGEQKSCGCLAHGLVPETPLPSFGVCVFLPLQDFCSSPSPLRLPLPPPPLLPTERVTDVSTVPAGLCPPHNAFIYARTPSSSWNSSVTHLEQPCYELWKSLPGCPHRKLKHDNHGGGGNCGFSPGGPGPGLPGRAVAQKRRRLKLAPTQLMSSQRKKKIVWRNGSIPGSRKSRSQWA